MTSQHISRLICTVAMVLVAGAIIAPLDTVICNLSTSYQVYFSCSGILLCGSIALIGASFVPSMIRNDSVGGQVASVLYPATGALALLCTNVGGQIGGFISAILLGVVWGLSAFVAHRSTAEVVDNWLRMVRSDADFRAFMYVLVVIAAAFATMCKFWYPTIAYGYVIGTFVEWLFICVQFACIFSASLFVLYSFHRGTTAQQLGSVALAGAVVAEVLISVPYVVFYVSWGPWLQVDREQMFFFACFSAVSMLASVVFYGIENGVETGLWAESTTPPITGPVVNAG